MFATHTNSLQCRSSVRYACCSFKKRKNGNWKWLTLSGYCGRLAYGQFLHLRPQVEALRAGSAELRRVSEKKFQMQHSILSFPLFFPSVYIFLIFLFLFRPSSSTSSSSFLFLPTPRFLFLFLLLLSSPVLLFVGKFYHLYIVRKHRKKKVITDKYDFLTHGIFRLTH